MNGVMSAAEAGRPHMLWTTDLAFWCALSFAALLLLSTSLEWM